MPKGVYERTPAARANIGAAAKGRAPWNKGLKGAAKHGHTWRDSAGRSRMSPTYRAWSNMRQRVRTPAYAERGITVCERWSSFENFLADMGERPDGLSLDRSNNDGNYEPGNCRWADWSTQMKNRRPSAASLANLVPGRGLLRRQVD